MRWVLLAVVVAACGPDRHFEISDRESPLASADMGWSTTGGSLGLTPTGSNQFPHPLTLRLRVYDDCGDNDECFQELVSGSIYVVAGSPCEPTVSTRCSGTNCYAELSVTGLGNCVLRARATTEDGGDEESCWYRAVYEADDPFDEAVFAMYEAQTDRRVADCRDDL